MRRIRDRVIYDAPGYTPGMKRPILVIEIGEDGDLIEHAAFDADDENALSLIYEWLPETLIRSLQEEDDS